MNDLYQKENHPKNENLTLNYNISEIIARYMFEKILSLTITQINKNKIERNIPDFCFKDIKQTLEIAIIIEFLNHDRDDIEYMKKAKLNSKSETNLMKLNIEDKINKKFLIKNKSEKLKKYKLNKYLDPNVSFENSTYLRVFSNKKPKKKKNQKGILKFTELIERDDDSYSNKDKEEKNNDKKNKNEDPFIINANEEIEHIKKIEIHKLDYNPIYFNISKNNNKPKLLYDTIDREENKWEIISQPSPPPIDRDGATKIKYVQPVYSFEKRASIRIKDSALEEIKEQQHTNKIEESKKDIKNDIKKDKNKKKNKKKIKLKNNEEDNGSKRKKYMPIIEFPSEDIDPKVLGKEKETEEYKQLRIDLEKEINEKKIEAAKKLKKEQERLALEKTLEEKRKELANKNVTTDIKGELVYIKSLKIDDFINEFMKGKSNFKEIKTIEDDLKSKLSLRKKSSIKIEKNPDAYLDPEELAKLAKKGRNKNQFHPAKKSNISDERNQANNKDKNARISKDKNKMKNKPPLIAAGSNFSIMNPECGVNLTEDKKTKSGGKDYFKKYNKYSFQVFEETLNKTATSNFYQNRMNNPNNNTNVMSLRKKSLRDQILEEKDSDNKQNNTNNNINLTLPNELNNKLFVKTKNLRRALNDLDLITEGEEKAFSQKKNNMNLLKRKKFIVDFKKKEKRDYDEINKFAKTLVGEENWGNKIYENITNLKKNFRMPTKPIFDELKREVPLNILNHLPRKRLPPINNNNRFRDNSMEYTVTEGFYNKKRRNKLGDLYNEEKNSVQNEAKQNEHKTMDTKDEDNNFRTTSNFYQNTII